MTISVKPRIFRLPVLGVLLCLPALIALLGVGGLSYRQYQDSRALLQRAEPVLEALHHLHHRVMLLDIEGGTLLDEEVKSLALMLSRFVAFLEPRAEGRADLVRVIEELNGYQQQLRALQEADIRSRYTLRAFADSVLALNNPAAETSLGRLLQLSRLYLYAPSPQFVAELEEEADRLMLAADPRLDEVLYAHRLYRDSLATMVNLRRQLAYEDIAELVRWKTRRQQDAENRRDELLLTLVLSLLLLFSLGLLLLYYRNRQLRQASESSFALARAKTDFLANMSHEIRTPMNAIIGFASLMQQTPLDLQQAEYLKKIKSSSDNLLLLINDILDLTKVEAGKLELEDIDFDLNQQLERLSGLFADMSEQKQLEVIINKAPEVPDFIRGDPLRLGQVLVNLVNNAVKFTERGEVVLSVSVGGEPASPRLCFEVRDTGIGIMPEQLDKLFQSFTQLDASTTRKYGGSGLGLNITRHLVQLMRGQIAVQSLPGRGSTFTVSLPLRRTAEMTSEVPSPAFVPGQKVLLVDDNALVVEVMSRLLRQAGFVVYAAADLESARDIVLKRGAELRLALIDCCLGRDNGLELARYLVQQPHLRGLDIVIISAFGRERPSSQMRALGLTHYLSKPVTQSSLLDCLALVLNGAGQGMRDAAAPVREDTDYYRSRLAGRQILLAEDNRVNQQLIIEFLKKVEVSVTLADNGRQAVEQAARRAFDAILMDLQMPILDGLEATRQIRKLRAHHDVPIIALTASAMRGDRETSLRAGMNGYVTKPVNRRDLYQALLQVVTDKVLAPAGGEAEPAGSPSMLDRQAALARQTEAAWQQALRQFIGEHQDELWLLQAALAGPNWQEAGFIARRLVELAESIGAERLAGKARQLLDPLSRHQRPAAPLLDELSRVFEKTRQQAMAELALDSR
ncbi:hybrid sensor histidine kinase/response regulator [Zobellella endophytica]|uniref:hybrid sensor histidine kinase/response regulator n=1 Tax=Zobellella endophytica TaxID=2116700 RepID=UPI0011B228FF|nr:response regulator [Zobellella endophytica]